MQTDDTTAGAVKPEPTPLTSRKTSIDLLRGVAVLAILYMNIQSFSMIEAAYFNPSAYGNLSGLNFAVWVVGRLFFDMKFMAIFSMLFGAGIILMAERIEHRGNRPAGVHYRRMFWLLVFGAGHAYLIWYGDILFLYAVIGMIVYVGRRWRPGVLVISACVLFTFGLGLQFMTHWSMGYWPEADLREFMETYDPPPVAVEEELDIYRSGWMGQMGHRAATAFMLHTFLLFFFFLWRVGGLMLLGMALYKWGVFSAERSTRFYGGMATLGMLIGLPLIAYGVYLDASSGWNPRYSFFLYNALNYVGSVPVALGWVGIVMLAFKGLDGAAVVRPFAAVGQTALTNYLMQSIICTFIFYGHGLGMFGKLERIEQLGVVVAVWVFQVIAAPFWLRRYRFGPFEWLWRSLTYWRFETIRRGA